MTHGRHEMQEQPVEYKVVNNKAARRFEIQVGEHFAFSEYILDNPYIVYHHTEVPVHLEGRGLASRIIRTALDYAREQGYTVVPSCPFVAGYIKKHPEYQDLVAEGY